MEKKMKEEILYQFDRRYGDNILNNIFSEDQLKKMAKIEYNNIEYKKCFEDGCGRFYSPRYGRQHKFQECWQCFHKNMLNSECDDKFKKAIKEVTFWY